MKGYIVNGLQEIDGTEQSMLTRDDILEGAEVALRGIKMATASESMSDTQIEIREEIIAANLDQLDGMGG